MCQNYTIHPELENHHTSALVVSLYFECVKLMLFLSFKMVSHSSMTLLSLSLHSSLNSDFQNYTAERELTGLSADAHSSEQCSGA
jgi:hypothetical protein